MMALIVSVKLFEFKTIRKQNINKLKSLIDSYDEGLDSQGWILEHAEDEYYYVKNEQFSDYVLDVSESSYDNRTNVTAYPKTGNDNQKWPLIVRS
ncbi:hypothetical protein SAMN04488168_10653 [Bacillus sp. 491mf]|uniref:RICIN domain-containing protein n=3 Tax=Bacillus TaxID=1386 RepID=UPI0008EF4084|nr:hypothetical protein SAMN04488168_10653 [Bacillus sp. 491mf]